MYFVAHKFLASHMTTSTGACSVVSTIFKPCPNDWISENGTCYEDSCCTSYVTARSWYYRLAQLSHVVFSCFALIVIPVYTWRYSSKHMLPENVRVLINIMLLLMFAHSIDMILIHTYHIYQSFLVVASNPCFVRVQVSFCALYRYTYSFCTLGLTTCQYCLYIDRLLCAFYRHYVRRQKTIRNLLLFKCVATTGLVVAWVYREEDSDSYLLSCLNIPLASMVDLSLVTAAVFPINLICFFLSITMFRHFKKKEDRSRFDINVHFTAAVDVESSEFLYYVTRTQAIFIVLYPILIMSVRFFYEITPRPLHLTLATLGYVFDIYTFAVPLVMIDYSKKTTGNRKEKIWKQVKLKSVGKEGADHYFGMIKSQWE
ncbi:unnamed protein product [Caenorhabditis sp. 36 PRJEB53466]|nr:unnamed protein product [Caenorhabditis sp. 36 PRJEB53466]